MRSLAERLGDCIDEGCNDMPEASPGGGIPGYDAWRTATPPEYAEQSPPWEQVTGPARPRIDNHTPPTLCTLPPGHHGPCNFGKEPR
jgi:hypothetical protein